MQNRSPIRDALSWMRSIFLLDPLIYVYTVVLGALSLLSSLFDRSGRIQHGLARLWSRMILTTAMSPVEISGLERIDTSKPAVYAVNHASALDIPVIFGHLPFQFRILAKKELFRWPILGWHLKRSGQIPVERESARASMRSLKLAVDTLRAGMPLVVFPEGGRSADGRIRPFLQGAFYAAIRAGVDVVPMALVGAYQVLPMDTYHIRPGRIRLLIGEPVATTGYSVREMENLSDRVKKIIEEMYYGQAQPGAPGLAAELRPAAADKTSAPT